MYYLLRTGIHKPNCPNGSHYFRLILSCFVDNFTPCVVIFSQVVCLPCSRRKETLSPNIYWRN